MTRSGRTAVPLLAVAEELAGMGSWVFDLGSRETLWSEGMYRILDLPSGEAARSVAEVFERVHPEDRERMERLLAEVTARPEAVPKAGIEHAVRMLRADGSVRELRALGRGAMTRRSRRAGSVRCRTSRSSV